MATSLCLRHVIPVAILTSAIIAAGCHGPVIGGAALDVGGTIAGVVRGTDDSVRLSGRKVTATNLQTGAKFEATTAANGGYTIPVPRGTYRLDVELRPNEILASRPDDTQVNASDLDPSRDFEITPRPPGGAAP